MNEKLGWPAGTIMLFEKGKIPSGWSELPGYSFVEDNGTNLVKAVKNEEKEIIDMAVDKTAHYLVDLL
jgi:hypothetical protein